MEPRCAVMRRVPKRWCGSLKVISEKDSRFDSRLHNDPPLSEDQSYRSNRRHRFQRFRNRTPTSPRARESAPPARPLRTAHPENSRTLRQPRQPSKNGPPRAHR
jgi:hypothetical protein